MSPSPRCRHTQSTAIVQVDHRAQLRATFRLLRERVVCTQT